MGLVAVFSHQHIFTGVQWLSRLCVCVCGGGGGGGGEEPVPEFLWSLCLVAYMKVPFLRERLNTLLSPNIILSFLHYNLTNICITQALTQDKQVSKSSASLCVTSKNG